MGLWDTLKQLLVGDPTYLPPPAPKIGDAPSTEGNPYFEADETHVGNGGSPTKGGLSRNPTFTETQETVKTDPGTKSIWQRIFGTN